MNIEESFSDLEINTKINKSVLEIERTPNNCDVSIKLKESQDDDLKIELNTKCSN
jgi:hypothetical protein